MMRVLLVCILVCIMLLSVELCDGNTSQCGEWTQWTSCNRNELMQTRTRTLPPVCNETLVDFNHCQERLFPELAIDERATKPLFESASVSTCMELCRQHNCAAVQYKAKKCQGFSRDFVTTPGSNETHVAIVYPGLLYNVSLENHFKQVTTRNIIECLKMCEEESSCLAITFDNHRRNPNCFIVYNKNYSVSKTPKKGYLTWFKREKFLQLLTLKRGLLKEYDERNPHQCADYCRSLQPCRASVFNKSDGKCKLFSSFESYEYTGDNNIVWLNNETHFNKKSTQWQTETTNPPSSEGAPVKRNNSTVVDSSTYAKDKLIDHKLLIVISVAIPLVLVAAVAAVLLTVYCKEKRNNIATSSSNLDSSMAEENETVGSVYEDSSTIGTT